MELQRIEKLIEKYLDGLATSEERDEVEYWYAMIQEDTGPAAVEPGEEEQEFRRFISRVSSPEKRGHIRLYRFIGWAAAVVVILSALLWPYLHDRIIADHRQMVFSRAGDKIENNVLLRLADGRMINVDQQKTGNFEPVEGMRLNIAKGLLEIEEPSSATVKGSNILSTPFQRRYSVNLPDGSRVWLNSKSSIRFPNNFGDAERTVDVTGEAYFEVSHRQNKAGRVPFIVRAAGQEITVMGTHFNVNAYPGSFRAVTTLFEGSVNVRDGAKQVRLRPGEAASSSPGSLLLIPDPDLDRAVAWRRNVFIFDRSGIRDILESFSHWYGMEVIYRAVPEKTVFSGKIPMELDIHQALKIVEQTDVSFRVDGQKIYVESRR